MKIANFKKINNETTKIKLSQGIVELTVNNNDVTEFYIKKIRGTKHIFSMSNPAYSKSDLRKRLESFLMLNAFKNNTMGKNTKADLEKTIRALSFFLRDDKMDEQRKNKPNPDGDRSKDKTS